MATVENSPYRYPQTRKVDGWGRICYVDLATGGLALHPLQDPMSLSMHSMLIILQWRADRSGQESLQRIHQSTQFHNSSTVPKSHSTFHPWNILSVCVINSDLDNNLASKTSACSSNVTQSAANRNYIGSWKGHESWWQEIDSINDCPFGLSMWIRILGNPIDHDSSDPHKEFDPDQLSLCVIKVIWLMTSVLGNLALTGNPVNNNAK